LQSAHYSLVSNVENECAPAASPNTADYQKSLQSALATCPEAKVLAYKVKAPAPPEGHMNNLRVLYSQNKSSVAPRKPMRSIPTTAERILDAPELRDDYYLNLLDWHGSDNLLAVALGPAVYIWNAETSGITKLCELPNEDSYVCSVSWMGDGDVLAVGTDDSTVQIWDTNNLKRLRTMRGHQV
jgi:cell division cycle protein 20 (cofactor of APC complex)